MNTSKKKRKEMNMSIISNERMYGNFQGNNALKCNQNIVVKLDFLSPLPRPHKNREKK